MKIIGYSNSNNYFPSPLVAFAQNNQTKTYHAVFPSGRVVSIDNFEEIKKDIPHYIIEERDVIIQEGEYAFGIDCDTILIGNPYSVHLSLEHLANSKTLDQRESGLLTEFLHNTSQDKNLTWLDYIESISNVSSVRVLITNRSVKRRKGEERPTAKRIVIQSIKNNNYKSCLRKNLFVGQSLNELPMINNFILSVFSPKPAFETKVA